jgi:hypothetical protein
VALRETFRERFHQGAVTVAPAAASDGRPLQTSASTAALSSRRLRREVVSTGSLGRHSRPNLAHTFRDEPGRSPLPSSPTPGSASASRTGYGRAVAEALTDWWLLGAADAVVMGHWRGDGNSFPRTAASRGGPRLRSVFAPPLFSTAISQLAANLTAEAAAKTARRAAAAQSEAGCPTVTTLDRAEVAAAASTAAASLATASAAAIPKSTNLPLLLRLPPPLVCAFGCSGGSGPSRDPCDCGDNTPLAMWPFRSKLV